MTNQTIVSCVEFRDLVTEYFEKALSPAITLEMEQHRNECESCDEFQRQIQLTIEALGVLSRQKSAETLHEGLLSAFRTWRGSAAQGPMNAEEMMGGLVELSGNGLKRAVDDISSRSLRILGQMSLDEAVRMGVVEPSRAVDFAEVGVAIFRRESDENGSNAEEANEKLAEALAVLGNAKRICSDLRGAGEAFRASDRYLDRVSGTSVHRANVLQLRAVYFAECGELSGAVESIDEAISTYQSIGDPHLVGRALIGKGTLLRSFGEPAIAVEILRSGMELTDSCREPRLALVAKHNLVCSLVESGSRQEALNILNEARDSHAQLGNPVDLIRLMWLEGSIALDLGEVFEAEELFLKVKSYFVEHEMPHDVALVSLDLAMVYLKQARIAELKELAAEMVTISTGLGIRRELIAALAFFNKAKEIEQAATMSFLQELIEVAEKARQRGALRSPLSMSN